MRLVRLDLPTLGRPIDGNGDAVLLHDSLAEIEVGADSVQQVAGAVTVDGRDGQDLVETQVIELVDSMGGLAGLIALVDGQNDRLVAAAQHVGNVLVRGGQAVAHVHYHDDAVGSIDGDLCLLAHVGQNALGRLGSIPPVSTSMKSWPLHSQFAKMRSRVMPGVSSTMARR